MIRVLISVWLKIFLLSMCHSRFIVVQSTDVLNTPFIEITNAYTKISGPIGEDMYKWDVMNTGSYDLIIDVAYPAFIQVREPLNSCSYKWVAKLVETRAQDPIFDGVFFTCSRHKNFKTKITENRDTPHSIFLESDIGSKVGVLVRDPSSWLFSVRAVCDDEEQLTSSTLVHFMPVRREIRYHHFNIQFLNKYKCAIE
jgi:hypothetical protein